MALTHRILRDSAIILNKKGESGHPCLNHFFKVNCRVGEPLTRTEMEAVERHGWIQALYLELNPIKDIIKLRYTQLTLLNAFSNSTLNKRPAKLLFLNQSIISIAISEQSKICLPLMKEN